MASLGPLPHSKRIQIRRKEIDHDAQKYGDMKTDPGNRASTRLTAAEMRKVEADAIASGAVTGAALMERAGRGAVATILAHWDWPEASGAMPAAPKAVVLCGPGNNGGDGYVIARGLRERGWRVEVFAIGDASAMPPDARAARAAWAAAGAVSPLAAAPAALGDAELVVDALFGIGLSRPLDGHVADVLAAVPDAARRVAIDVPSGFDTDRGCALGPAFDADLAVTFHAEKPVHAALAAHGVVVSVVDIGL